MNNIVQTIVDYPRFELSLFYNEVFIESPELAEVVLKYFKSLPEEELQTVYAKFSGMTNIDWMIEELTKIEKVFETELGDIENKVKEIINVLIPVLLAEIDENTQKAKEQMLKDREILKAGDGPFVKSDQMMGIDFPPMQKSIEAEAEIINLPEVDTAILKKSNILDCIRERISRRQFAETELSLKELSFLLWATQGVKNLVNNNKISKRTVPSGGSRHPFETYLAVHRVEGLKTGIYRYQPLEHQLVYLFAVEDLQKKIINASCEQTFVGECAVTFIWSAVPYRTEWRYALHSKKDILLDCGHLCQNLYLACEAIGCGTCGIAAYEQKKYDELLQLDGIDEFVVYLAPVGVLSVSSGQR